MYAFARPDKKRPVLVISRQSVIPLLRTVMVAPITSAIHGVPSEVLVGTEHGLKHESAANLDHVQTVDRSRLSGFIGHLNDEVMDEVCRALAVATGCRRST
jgi:mRNA interferase MazF